MSSVADVARLRQLLVGEYDELRRQLTRRLGSEDAAREVLPLLGPRRFLALFGTTVLAGASGFWMTHRFGLWSRFADPAFWWMHAMVGLWAIFAAMLFVIEPLFLHRRMEESLKPAADFDRMEVVHRGLLGLAVVTLLGAVAGSHGLL